MQGLPTACRLLVSDSTWHSGSLTRLRAREGGAADPTIGPQRATCADDNCHAREPRLYWSQWPKSPVCTLTCLMTFKD